MSNMRILLDAIPMNVVVYRYVEDDFIFIDINKMAEVTEKITKDKIIGKYLTDVFPALEEFGLFDVLMRVYKTGVEEEFELAFYEDERMSGWRHNKITKLENDDIVAIYSDLTKEKKLEEESISQKQELEKAQRLAHLGSWRLDIKKNEATWSDETFRIFGEEPQSFTPTYEIFLSFLKKEDQIHLAEIVQAAMQTRQAYQFEHEIVCSNGTKKHLLELGNIEFDSQDNAIAIFGTTLDITERKKTQKQLESFRSIVDNSMNEIYIFDAKTLLFTYINQSASSNIGYTLQEMLRMTPVDIKPEHNLFSFKQIMEPLFQDEKSSLIIETLHQRKDSTTYNVEIRIQRMLVDNREQFVVVANDISERKLAQLEILESEEKFRSISENAMIGIFIYHDTFIYANDAFLKITGYTREEVYQFAAWEIIEESFQNMFREVMNRRLKGESFPKEYIDVKIITKNGQVKIVRGSTETIKYKGRYVGMGSLMEVTDIIETKQQLQLLAQAVEQMDELVRITDKDGIITYVNDALVAHSGYRQVELIGQNINIFKSGKHSKAFYKDLWDTILGGKTYKCTFINRKKDKTLYYEEETITPMMDDDGNIKHFIATSQDITERVALDEELHKLATIDSLTGIYNRHHTNEEIDIEISRAGRISSSFALLMFDIDNFKDVNDMYGHDVGDYVLQELSNLVLNNIRESDRFGRWGGEEFMLILPDTDKVDAIMFAEKIRELISRHLFKEIHNITVSIGVAIFNMQEQKESLLKRVDNALYEAKNDGRNCVRYDS